MTDARTDTELAAEITAASLLPPRTALALVRVIRAAGWRPPPTELYTIDPAVTGALNAARWTVAEGLPLTPTDTARLVAALDEAHADLAAAPATRITPGPRAAHVHELWQLRVSERPSGGWFCAACGDRVTDAERSTLTK